MVIVFLLTDVSCLELCDHNIMPHPTARWRTRPSARPTSKHNDVWRRTSSLLEVGSGGWMRKAYYNRCGFWSFTYMCMYKFWTTCYAYYKFAYMHIMIIDYFILVWTWTLYLSIYIYIFFIIHDTYYKYISTPPIKKTACSCWFVFLYMFPKHQQILFR